MDIQLITRRVLALALLAIPAVAADDNEKDKGKEKNYAYLALGDSIPFGLDLTKLPPFVPLTNLPTPDDFKGYPEFLAEAIGENHVNASCPGETAASFMDVNKPDNGCNGPGPQGQPPFKTSIGLHANYKVAQMKFALAQLDKNKEIKLVTLSIGGNEILFILGACASNANPPACIDAMLPAALKDYRRDLEKIVAAIRDEHKENFVLVQYYSPFPLLDVAVRGFNGVMADLAKKYHLKLADGFNAFKLASASFQGDACKAGLLSRLGPNNTPPCDVHPSAYGQQVLALAVAGSLLKL